MITSAVATAALGPSSSMLGFVGAMLANGVARATGWPGTTEAVADAAAPAKRGRVMGVWTTCYQVGGIAATALAAWAMHRRSWRAALVIASVGALVWVTLDDARPKVVDAEGDGDGKTRGRAAAVTLVAYGVSYFFAKIIRYSLLLWLPWLLKARLGFSVTTAAALSIGLEVGGGVGAIALGAASTFGVTAAAAALLFGPDALISGAASQELGGRDGAARATGLVNGIGSIGAVVQGCFLVGANEAWGVAGRRRVLVVAAQLRARARPRRASPRVELAGVPRARCVRRAA